MTLALALCASACWGVSGFFGPMLARTYGTLVVLMLIQLVGLVVVSVGALIVKGLPSDPVVLWAVAAAIAGCLGITAYYRATSVGKLSVVAPIAGVAAGVPVIFGFAMGERLSVAECAGVACALLGITFVSVQRNAAQGTTIAAGGGFAIAAALGLGLYYPAMHEAATAGVMAASLTFRCAMLTFIAGALFFIQRPAAITWPPVLTMALIGTIDAAATVFFALASTQGALGPTSVIASLYPLFVVAFAAALLGERLSSPQRVGATLCFVGIVLLAS